MPTLTTTYVPTLEAQLWKELAPFVATAVAGTAGKTAYSEADLYQSCTRLTAWVHQQPDLTLDEATVFAPEVIERFVQEGLSHYSPASRGNRRSTLMRMSEALIGTPARSDIFTPLPASEPSAPYITKEIDHLRRWSVGQAGERRNDAKILIALGLGAGLSASEITAVRVRDITITNGDATIRTTGHRPRHVAVDNLWAAALSTAVASRSSDQFAFCPARRGAGKNLVTNFIARAKPAGLELNTRRMRATWLVGHMQNGTTVTILMEAAGVTSLDALGRYVGFVGKAA